MRDLKNVYSSHLKEKTRTLLSLLGRLGRGGLCRSIVPSAVEGGFRNRAKFKIFGQGERARIRGTDPLRGEVPLEESLWILPEWGSDLVRGVADYLRRDPKGESVDGFEVKLTHGRQEGHVTLSVKPKSRCFCDELSGNLLEETGGLKGVAIPSHKREYGESYLRHRLLDLDICAHYSAFFQSNLVLTPELVEKVIDLAGGSRCRRLYDLYCGVGLFSLFLRHQAGEILGWDHSPLAVESARMNAGSLEMRHAQFICASVESSVDRLLESRIRDGKDLVLLNPPRSGVPSLVINAAASLCGEKIGLVSCCLETHVRDLRHWRRAGYVIDSIAAFDMFPFTDFVETVTLLRREN